MTNESANLPPEVREYFRQLGLKGGKARAAKLTPEERSALARKGQRASVKARRARKALQDNANENS